MPNRPQDHINDAPDAFAGQAEWHQDTLDKTTPQTGARPRGFPCGTLVFLLLGLGLLGAMAFLLIGPLLPGGITLLPDPTPTSTLTLPTQLPTVTPIVLPTDTPTPLPPQGIFGVGDRVAITNSSAQGVRVRAGGGLDFATQVIAYDGDVFIVLPAEDDSAEYPVQSDGYTWWRVRTENDLVGWIAEIFLTPAPLVEEPTATP